MVEMDWKSKASAPLLAMEVVEIDAFESGRLSTKVRLGGGRGPNSALRRVNVLLATDNVVWVLLKGVV